MVQDYRSPLSASTRRIAFLALSLLNAEDADEVTVTSVTDGKRQKIKTTDIKERTHAPSPMPPGLGEVLGKHDLRDIVEFLATGKTKAE